MKKLIGLAVFFTMLLAACTLPALPFPINKPGTPTLSITVSPTQPLLTSTPSATLSPASLTAQALTEAENKKLEATDTTFLSFCASNTVPLWGPGTGQHVKEIAPDWFTLVCHSNDWSTYYQQFVYKRGIKIWKVTLSDMALFAPKNSYVIKLDVDAWSKDRKAIYLSPSYYLENGTSDPWNPSIPFRYTTGFYRLNVETGSFDVLLDPNAAPGVEVAYAMSPDQNYLIFAKITEKNIFYVRNMLKGTDKKIELKSNVENIGDFVWTPDSKTVIFVAAPEGWRDNKTGTFIYTYSLATNQVTVLVHNDLQQRMPFPVPGSNDNNAWLQKNFLNLISAQNGLDQWKLDIRNGYVGSVATPTPKP